MLSIFLTFIYGLFPPFQSSKDFIGMAVKNNTLRCVYKLGGVIHELNTDHITRAKVNSTVFDKVVFNRYTS